MSSIPSLGAGVSPAMTGDTAQAAPAAKSDSVKINYGDPARAEGLNNMLTKIRQLTANAQSVVLARNSTLQ